MKEKDTFPEIKNDETYNIYKSILVSLCKISTSESQENIILPNKFELTEEFLEMLSSHIKNELINPSIFVYPACHSFFGLLVSAFQQDLLSRKLQSLLYPLFFEEKNEKEKYWNNLVPLLFSLYDPILKYLLENECFNGTSQSNKKISIPELIIDSEIIEKIIKNKTLHPFLERFIKKTSHQKLFKKRIESNLFPFLFLTPEGVNILGFCGLITLENLQKQIKIDETYVSVITFFDLEKNDWLSLCLRKIRTENFLTDNKDIEFKLPAKLFTCEIPETLLTILGKENTGEQQTTLKILGKKTKKILLNYLDLEQIIQKKHHRALLKILQECGVENSKDIIEELLYFLGKNTNFISQLLYKNNKDNVISFLETFEGAFILKNYLFDFIDQSIISNQIKTNSKVRENFEKNEEINMEALLNNSLLKNDCTNKIIELKKIELKIN